MRCGQLQRGGSDSVHSLCGRDFRRELGQRDMHALQRRYVRGKRGQHGMCAMPQRPTFGRRQLGLHGNALSGRPGADFNRDV